MSAVPFRQGREGLYANLGSHTVLVARRRSGYEVSVDGAPLAEGLGYPAAQRRAQEVAHGIRESLIAEGDGTDPYDVMGQSAHPAGDAVAEDATTNEKESTMTTKTETTKPERTAVQSAALAKANERRAATAAAKREAKAKADRATARGANRAEITRRFGESESVATIAAALGISQGRVRQILMDSGLVKVASRNPERDARIVEAIDKGEDPAVVAEREGVKEFRARWIHKVAKAGAA